MPVLRPVRGDELRVAAHDGRVGRGDLEVHPIAILTNKSAGTQYSLRAANAAACVAGLLARLVLRLQRDPLREPARGGLDRPHERRAKSLAEEVGVSNQSTIETCIDDVQFKSWVQDATNRALTQPVPNSELPSITGTPTVLVNGQQYGGSLEDPQEFQAFVLQATNATFNDSESTPTPTPTPTQ